MLHDEQPALREASARVLGQIGDPRALPTLAEMTTDGHWATREAACAALAKFGAPATQQLVAALHSPHDDVRWIAANGLEKIGWQPEKNEGGVLYCIAKGKWDQCAAMGALAVPALIHAIQHWDENVRKGAAWSLAHIGHPAVQPLIGVLKGDDPYAREAAASTLGQIGSAQAIEPLGAALKDDYAEVRQAAVGALVRLRAPVELFVPALKNEEPEVRKAAAWALGHSGNPSMVKPLVMALREDDVNVKITVIDALGELGSESAMQSLLTLMNDPTPEIRAAVSRATERISQT
jgi:HEAT repeat protein